jgi:hypothetical protein
VGLMVIPSEKGTSTTARGLQLAFSDLEPARPNLSTRWFRSTRPPNVLTRTERPLLSFSDLSAARDDEAGWSGEPTSLGLPHPAPSPPKVSHLLRGLLLIIRSNRISGCNRSQALQEPMDLAVCADCCQSRPVELVIQDLRTGRNRHRGTRGSEAARGLALSRPPEGGVGQHLASSEEEQPASR